MAIPHKERACIAQSDFSADCTEILQTSGYVPLRRDKGKSTENKGLKTDTEMLSGSENMIYDSTSLPRAEVPKSKSENTIFNLFHPVILSGL